jgi:tetratricopeptide (TPR) repeat protein
VPAQSESRRPRSRGRGAALAAAAGGTAAALVINRQNQSLITTNGALENANIALVEATARAKQGQLVAEEKQKLALKAALAANTQNRNAVDTEVKMLTLLEDRLRYIPGLQDVRSEMLTHAINNLDDAASVMTSMRDDNGWPAEDEEKFWRTLARAHRRFGDHSLSLNRFTDAMKQYRLMDEIIDTMAKASPADPLAQFRLARTRRQLGFVAMNKLGDSAQGQNYLRQAIEINRACLAKKPDDDTFKRELANSLGQLATSELTLGHLEKARDLYVEEGKVRDSFSTAMANDFESRRELSGYYERVSELKLRMNEPGEGLRYNDLSTAIRKQILTERPELWPAVSDLVRCYNNAGRLHFPLRHDPVAARELHRQALALIEERATADPPNLETQLVLAETLYYDATCALHSGKAEAAKEQYRRCLEIRKKLVTEPDAKLPKVNLMLALARCGYHAEAAQMAGQLIESPPRESHLYFQAACGYALAASATADAGLARRYTSAAVDCLKKGKKDGWSDLVSLATDPDLEPIRNDSAFQALLAEFRGPGGKRP